ncbi:unnamed protein product [Lampetra fluviatilis]
MQMRALEEEKQRSEESERRAEAERRKEERRLQKLRAEEQARRTERRGRLEEAADGHRRRRLLLRFGLRPLALLVRHAHDSRRAAELHHRLSLLRACVLAWSAAARDVGRERERRAASLRSRHLQGRALAAWTKYVGSVRSAEEEACGMHRRKLAGRAFRAWRGVAAQERLALWEKEEVAIEHSNRRRLSRALAAWQRLPALARQERERETRLAEMRKKVAQLLPDFRS